MFKFINKKKCGKMCTYKTFRLFPKKKIQQNRTKMKEVLISSLFGLMFLNKIYIFRCFSATQYGSTLNSDNNAPSQYVCTKRNTKSLAKSVII